MKAIGHFIFVISDHCNSVILFLQQFNKFEMNITAVQCTVWYSTSNGEVGFM